MKIQRDVCYKITRSGLNIFIDHLVRTYLQILTNIKILQIYLQKEQIFGTQHQWLLSKVIKQTQTYLTPEELIVENEHHRDICLLIWIMSWVIVQVVTELLLHWLTLSPRQVLRFSLFQFLSSLICLRQYLISSLDSQVKYFGTSSSLTSKVKNYDF